MDYAQNLKDLVDEMNCLPIDTETIDSSSFSMENYWEVVNKINEDIAESYCNGMTDKVDYLISKLRQVCDQMESFNQNFGL